MSLERRRRLLRQAELDDFVVIEDDYEAENLYAGAPMPALKSLDKSGRVIYIGSVSKSLSPVLRLGFIVAPHALVQELRVIRHAMVRHPSAFLQHAYALFLSLGHHESHARRVNAAMQERIALAAEVLREELPDFAFTLPQGGASIWVRAPAWIDADELAAIARAARRAVRGRPGLLRAAALPVPVPSPAPVVDRRQRTSAPACARSRRRSPSWRGRAARCLADRPESRTDGGARAAPGCCGKAP